MAEHRGEILQNRLNVYSNDSGISLSRIAEKAGYDQSTLYRHFAKHDLKLHIIQRYAKAIQYDFSEEIPEIKDLFVTTLNSEGDSHSAAHWKNKYIELLERHNKMLEEKLLSS